MSRAEFARVTGFGEATLARWERGEVIQNTSNDSFLRMLMDRDAMKRLSRMTQYEDKLGREFSMIFHSLNNDWASALVRYKEFRELFGAVERVELLNAIGGGLFWDVQQMCWSDLMLRLTRLTDPLESAGRDNLTVQTLPGLCEDPDLGEEVEGLVRQAVDATEFARDWRNRRFSHSDLARPRARAFIAYASQLIGAVQYVDSIIDPSGDRPVTDLAAAETFLRKLQCRPTWQNTRQVFELREAARRFPMTL